MSQIGDYHDLDDVIEKIAKRSREAAVFLVNMLELSSIWDDLIDRDTDVTDAEINKAFETALVYLPTNRFYAEHLGILHPIVISSIFNWHIANKIERTQDVSQYNMSFIVRSSYADLFVMVAYLLAGRDFAIDIGIETRRIVHDEGLSEYVTSIRKEREAREAR